MTARIELEPGEAILKQAIARAFVPRHPGSILGRAGEGHLYLTNRRLAWRRGWWWLLMPGRFLALDFNVPIADIQACTVIGDSTQHFFGVRGFVVELRDGRQYKFAIAKIRLWPPAWWFSKAEAAEWAEALRQQGVVRA